MSAFTDSAAVLLPSCLSSVAWRYPSTLQRFPHQFRNRLLDRHIVGVAELLEGEVDLAWDLRLDYYVRAQGTSGSDKSREAQ